MRLFIYEYACAEPEEVGLPESVRREGRAMFEAVVEDARRLEPAVEVVTVADTQDSFQGVAGRADYALIIAPEFDGILEERARWVVEAGCQLLGPLPEAIRLTADKWALYQHWRSCGVATPRTWLPCIGARSQESGVRSLVKHRYGAGSLGVAWWNPSEAAPKDHLIQEYVEGEVVSVALLITKGGEIVPLLPARQIMDERFGYLGGSFLEAEQQCDRVIRLARAAVEGIPGLQGFVGVDAILGEAVDGGDDVVLEINPRITTSYLGLRQATRVNLIQLMLDVQRGVELVPISWDPGGIRWGMAGTS